MYVHIYKFLIFLNPYITKIKKSRRPNEFIKRNVIYLYFLILNKPISFIISSKPFFNVYLGLYSNIFEALFILA